MILQSDIPGEEEKKVFLTGGTPISNPTGYIIEPKVTPEMLEKLSDATQVPIKQLYVIYSHKHHSILHDPITQKPVFSTNPRHLDEAAAVFKGEIMTAQEAYKKLTNQ